MNKLDSQQKKFIQDNINGNTKELALKGVPIFILEQISSRQKSKTKIPSFYDNYDLLFPKNISIEQSSSEKTAIYKSSIISGQTAIDLTGGFGIDSIYLSSSFNKYIYNEIDEDLFNIARYNFNQLNKEIECWNYNAHEAILRLDKVDVIYLDPSRRKNDSKVFLLEDCSPNLIEIKDQLEQKAKNVLMKLSPMIDINQIYKFFGKNVEIHCLLYKNEVKELLVLTKKESKLVAVNLDKNISKEYTQPKKIESFKKQGKYIFLPDKHFLKLGLSDYVASEIGFYKPAKNVYLYFGDDRSFNYNLGRCFEVVEFKKASKSTIKSILNNNDYSIITKNYPLKSAELRKKYKVRESDKNFAFLFSACNEKTILTAKKI